MAALPSSSRYRWLTVTFVVLLFAAVALFFSTRRPTLARVEAQNSSLQNLRPDFSGAVSWLNSAPLDLHQLRGKVVVVDFWTYSCINCLRSLPWSEAWYERYKDSGLVVIGVHTPEFDFEKDPARIDRALKRYGIHFPVAVDSRRAIWDSFNNRYWPAHYFIDAKGVVREEHFGEGEYGRSEQWIRELLAERKGAAPLPPPVSPVLVQGEQLSADWAEMGSPETYIGSERAEHFASPGGQKRGRSTLYTSPVQLNHNQWALSGPWTVQAQFARLDQPGGRILFRFHARDLHLVLGPAPDGKPIRFRVRIDGHAPGPAHGSDCNENGEGVVDGERLYQLIRQPAPIVDHTFEIEFLDPGAQAFAFTFG